MKKSLRMFVAGVMALLLGGLTHNARASHEIGSELTYFCVAPGFYSVTLKLYRDCAQVQAANSATLVVKSPGCNNGRAVTLNKVSSRIGDPYCSQVVPGCGAVIPNYEEVQFVGNVIFSAAEQNCPNWTLSWNLCCRQDIGNLVNSMNASTYTEATINLSPGINNNAPEFNPMSSPILFVNHGQPVLLSNYALDADGDSLVYSLQDPLNSPNTTIAFGSYPATMAYNADSTKSVLLPAGNYNKTYPILSYAIDWTQPMPVTPVQKFMFDSKTGAMGFTPIKYERNSPQGKNKYVMLVQVDEYRKINGVPTKVGSVRRDMMVNVIDCGPNQNPKISAPVANGQPVTENDIINLRPGTPLNFQFATSDGNAANVLTLESDVASILPGAVFTKTSSSQPTGTITWTPTANMVRGQVYYFHITVQDNACPVKGSQTHTFGVKVSATGGVTGVSKDLDKPRFVAYPNPFSETVSFKLNITKGTDQQLVIYNALGQQVDKISLNGFAAGEQTVVWKNAAKMANGQYVAKLVSNQAEIQTIKFSKLQ